MSKRRLLLVLQAGCIALLVALSGCKKSRGGGGGGYFGPYAENYVTLAQWAHQAVAQELYLEFQTNGFVDRTLNANVSNIALDRVEVQDYYDLQWYDTIDWWRDEVNLLGYTTAATNFGEQFIETFAGEIGLVPGFTFDGSYGIGDLGTALGTNLTFAGENIANGNNPHHSNVLDNQMQIELYTQDLDLNDGCYIDGVIAGTDNNDPVIFGEFSVDFVDVCDVYFITNRLFRDNQNVELDWFWYATPVKGQGGFYYATIPDPRLAAWRANRHHKRNAVSGTVSHYVNKELSLVRNDPAVQARARLVNGMMKDAIVAQLPQRIAEDGLRAAGKRAQRGNFTAPEALKDLRVELGLTQSQGRPAELLANKAPTEEVTVLATRPTVRNAQNMSAWQSEVKEVEEAYDVKEGSERYEDLEERASAARAIGTQKRNKLVNEGIFRYR